MRCAPHRRAILVLALILAPSTARAQDGATAESGDSDVAKAREHFNRAQQLYDTGHPEAALLELQRAYEVKPNFRLLYNIGELAFTVHDYVGSMRAFEQFLADGGSEIEPQKRAEAENKLVTLRSLVGRLEIHTNADGAALSIDDEPIGKSPLKDPVKVNTGRHKVSATKEGYFPVSTVVAVLGDEKTSADLRLVPIATLAPVQTAQPEPKTPSRWTTWSWIGVGAAGALAAGSVAMFVASANADSDLQNIVYVGTTPSQEYLDKQSEVSRDRTIGIALAAAGAVTLGVTLFLTLTRDPAAPTLRLSQLSRAVVEF